MRGRAPSAPPDIDGYEFNHFLAGGGFSDVFVYTHKWTRRQDAVKVLLRHVGGKRSDFEAEAKAMAQLSAHSAIVTIYGAGITPDESPYLIMELCTGDVLAELKAKPYPVERVLAIGVAIAGGIETAHQMGILHRDVKPANILLTRSAKPALTDFGIAGSLDGGSTIADAWSTQWAPPEQIDGREMTPASDVYSLAATLWTMLAQRSPFALAGGPNDNTSLTGRVRSADVPPTRASGAPESLERVLRVAMAKNPAHRYPTAADFAYALNDVQNELRIQPTPLEVLPTAGSAPAAPSVERSGTVASGYTPIDPSGLASGTNASSTAAAQTAKRSLLRSQNPHHVARESAERASQVSKLPIPDVIETDTQLVLPSAPAEEPDANRVAPVTSQRVPAAVVGGSLAVIALAAGGYVLVSKGGFDEGTSTASASVSAASTPVDAVGEEVPPVKDLKIKPSGRRFVASWRNPDPREGDEFVYSVLDPANDSEMHSTAATSVTVAGVEGRTCVQVALVRANGRPSEFSKACSP